MDRIVQEPLFQVTAGDGRSDAFIERVCRGCATQIEDVLGTDQRSVVGDPRLGRVLNPSINRNSQGWAGDRYPLWLFHLRRIDSRSCSGSGLRSSTPKTCKTAKSSAR
jgi:hypothetical protein